MPARVNPHEAENSRCAGRCRTARARRVACHRRASQSVSWDMNETPRPAHRESPAPEAEATTLLGMLAEVLDLSAGLTVMLLPLLTTALPGVVLLLVAPAALLALAVAVPATLTVALCAPPYLLVR